MAATVEENWNGSAGTASDDDGTFPLFTREDVPTDDFDFFGGNSGDIVDAEIVEEPSGSKLKSDRPEPLDRGAKSGIPSIDEWQHFFSKVVIRLSTDFYIDYAFRDIDEDLLSPREVERIRLTDVERERMARPFAEYSNKSKFMRKRGRMIIASADSIDAVIQMGMWFSRVNRIAAKYRRMRGANVQRPQPVRASPIWRPRPPEQEVPDFEDRSNDDVSSGPPTTRGDHWRPPVGGIVVNTTGGG